MLRKIISGCLILLTPCALFAQDTGAAVIYGTGSVFLNGAPLSNSSAVTVGDVIQTRCQISSQNRGIRTMVFHSKITNCCGQRKPSQVI